MDMSVCMLRHIKSQPTRHQSVIRNPTFRRRHYRPHVPTTSIQNLLWSATLVLPENRVNIRHQVGARTIAKCSPNARVLNDDSSSHTPHQLVSPCTCRDMGKVISLQQCSRLRRVCLCSENIAGRVLHGERVGINGCVHLRTCTS